MRLLCIETLRSSFYWSQKVTELLLVENLSATDSTVDFEPTLFGTRWTFGSVPARFKLDCREPGELDRAVHVAVVQQHSRVRKLGYNVAWPHVP